MCVPEGCADVVVEAIPGDPLRAAALMTLVARILDDPGGQPVLARGLSRLERTLQPADLLEHLLKLG
ncbi:hypothetical protein [Streptomyces sp. NPDC055134]